MQLAYENDVIIHNESAKQSSNDIQASISSADSRDGPAAQCHSLLAADAASAVDISRVQNSKKIEGFQQASVKPQYEIYGKDLDVNQERNASPSLEMVCQVSGKINGQSECNVTSRTGEKHVRNEPQNLTFIEPDENENFRSANTSQVSFPVTQGSPVSQRTPQSIHNWTLASEIEQPVIGSSKSRLNTSSDSSTECNNFLAAAATSSVKLFQTSIETSSDLTVTNKENPKSTLGTYSNLSDSEIKSTSSLSDHRINKESTVSLSSPMIPSQTVLESSNSNLPSREPFSQSSTDCNEITTANSVSSVKFTHVQSTTNKLPSVEHIESSAAEVKDIGSNHYTKRKLNETSSLTQQIRSNTDSNTKVSGPILKGSNEFETVRTLSKNLERVYNGDLPDLLNATKESIVDGSGKMPAPHPRVVFSTPNTPENASSPRFGNHSKFSDHIATKEPQVSSQVILNKDRETMTSQVFTECNAEDSRDDFIVAEYVRNQILQPLVSTFLR